MDIVLLSFTIMQGRTYSRTNTTSIMWFLLLLDIIFICFPASLACPTDPCICRGGIITCSDMQMTQVPDFYYENNTYDSIDLGKNKIRMLKAKAFQDVSVRKIKIIRNQVPLEIHRKAFRGLEDVLETIYIAKSHVKALPSGLFKKMKKLKDIELTGNYNRLTMLPNGLFRGARNVQNLDLNRNSIMHLQAGVFTGLKKLTSLKLGDNKISLLEPNAFNGLQNLQELTLSANSIRDLQPYTFEKLPKLVNLDLSKNQIPALFPLMLTGTSELEELNLSENPIMWIADDAFSEMTKLKKLSMHKCQLSYLKARMFRGLSSLSTLRMNDNKLTFLKDGSLAYLTNLQILSLEHNKLRYMNPCAFNDITKVTEVWTLGNNIQCRCDMRWSSNTDVKVKGKCAGPNRLKNYEINDPKNYENCPKKMTKCPKIKRDETEENRTERKKRRRRMFRH